MSDMATRPGTTIPHGSIARYKGPHACRCRRCRDAVAAYMRDLRSRKENGAEVRSYGPAEHGTVSRYNGRKCRCEACKTAAAQYQRSRRSVGVS